MKPCSNPNSSCSQKRRLAESAASVEQALAVKAPKELAQYLSSMQHKTFPDLSELELGDRAIPGIPTHLLHSRRKLN